MMAPKVVHALIPRTCELLVTWKRGVKIADGIMIAAGQMALRWGDQPD